MLEILRIVRAVGHGALGGLFLCMTIKDEAIDSSKRV